MKVLIVYLNNTSQISKDKNANVLGLQQKSIFISFRCSIKTFLYFHTFEIKNAKVLKLFDENFNPVNKLEYTDGYVVFDQTCFYATSVGQIMILVAHNKQMGSFFVDEVIKAPNQTHVHHVVTTI